MGFFVDSNIFLSNSGSFPKQVDGGDIEKFQDTIVKGIPLGRIGKPRDIATVVLFLSGPSSSYVTGALLPLDGSSLVHSHL
jgi:NAD(P)-dependent dehydrogenase (short-subunit alcohol dehydrogenase family)